MIRSTSYFSSFPPQIKYIIGNEACERFSFYGMRSILVVFMMRYLMMTPSDAKAAFHVFASAVYLLPLLGAFISDRYFGKYRTIFWLSLIYCLGHLTLAIWDNRTGLAIGLSLIALGSGGIKPCVSAYVGEQFTEKNQSLLGRVFDLFYWSINFGSFFASLLIPFLLVKYGPSVAFGIPGVLMALATLFFWLGRDSYVNILPSKENRTAGFMEIVLFSAFHQKQRVPGRKFLDVALNKYTKEEVEGVRAVISIIKVFATVSIFWALFDQNSSSWVLQAQSMDLNFLGVHIEPAQMQALNPILVMMLIPVFGAWIYPTFEKLGVRMTALRKMSIGMFLAGFSFVMVGMIQGVLDSGHSISIAWQFLPNLLITCSEVMVSITGLEFAYTQAPQSMKSTIMGFWLLTVFAGNLLDAWIAKLNIFEGSTFFYFFAGLMFLVSIIFVFSASRYKLKKGTEQAQDSLAPA